MDRGAWQATVHGIAKVGLDLVTKPQPPISSSRKGRKVHMCAYTDTQTCTHTHTLNLAWSVNFHVCQGQISGYYSEKGFRCGFNSMSITKSCIT